jgi:hypothetical protein
MFQDPSPMPPLGNLLTYRNNFIFGESLHSLFASGDRQTIRQKSPSSQVLSLFSMTYTGPWVKFETNKIRRQTAQIGLISMRESLLRYQPYHGFISFNLYSNRAAQS